MKLQQTIVEENKKKLERLTKQYGNSSIQVTNFKIKLNASISELNKTRNEADKLNEELKDIDKNSSSAGKSLENNLNKKNGFANGIDAFKSFGSAAASALQGIVDLAAQVVTSIANIVTEVSSAADELVTLSQTSNLSLDTLSKISYAQARGFDVSVGTFAGAATKLRTSRNDKVFTEGMFKGLDVVTDEATGTKRDATTEELMWNILGFAASRYNPDGNNVELDEAMQSAIGRGYKDFMPYIEAGGSEAFEQVIADGLANGEIRTEQQLTMLASLDDGIQKIRATVESIRQLFVVMFSGVFGNIEEDYGELLGAANDMMNAEINGDTEGVTDASRRAQNAASSLFEHIGEFFQELIDKIRTALEGLAAEQILDENGNSTGQKTLLGKIAQTILDVFNWFESGGFQDFLSSIKEVFGKIKLLVDAVATFLGYNPEANAAAQEERLPDYVTAFGDNVSSDVRPLAEQLYDIYRSDEDIDPMGEREHQIAVALNSMLGDRGGVSLMDEVIDIATNPNKYSWTGEDLPDWFTKSDFETSMSEATMTQRDDIKAAAESGAGAIVGAIGENLKGMSFYVDGYKLSTIVAPYIDAGMSNGNFVPIVPVNE